MKQKATALPFRQRVVDIVKFWATACKTVGFMLSDPCLSVLSVCPVCLSVTLVYCGQTVGCAKMPLGMVAGLGPGHIVLDGDPAPQKATTPIFGPCLLWPKGWTDQDATWYRGRLRPKRHCIRWGPSSPSTKGTQQLPLFGPCLLWPNGWMDQDAIWYGGKP